MTKYCNVWAFALVISFKEQNSMLSPCNIVFKTLIVPNQIWHQRVFILSKRILQQCFDCQIQFDVRIKFKWWNKQNSWTRSRSFKVDGSDGSSSDHHAAMDLDVKNNGLAVSTATRILHRYFSVSKCFYGRLFQILLMGLPLFSHCVFNTK